MMKPYFAAGLLACSFAIFNIAADAPSTLPSTQPTTQPVAEKDQLQYKLSKNSENADPEIKAKIVAAMDHAVKVYNASGHAWKRTVTANYNKGTPTADANFDGWINFGGQIGGRTAIHELGHCMGAGTHPKWRSFIKEGKWTGEHAIAQLKAFDGPDAILHADRQHFWPYGLNFDKEGGPENERRHVLMLIAFQKDLGITE